MNFKLKQYVGISDDLNFLYITSDSRMIEFALLQQFEDEQEYLISLMRRRKEQIRTRNDFENAAVPEPSQSPWASLIKYGSDQAFINILGVDRAGFRLLASKFKNYYRHKFREGRGGRPAKVLFVQALGMVLQFYTAPIEIKTLGQMHGVRRSKATEILQKAEIAFSKTLKHEPLARIAWPDHETQREWAGWVEAKYPTVKGRFCFVDGKNFNVYEPSESDLQNAMYNGWLHSALITGVLCYGVDGTLIWGKHNIVGSWNDGDMCRDLIIKLIDPAKTLPDHGAVADTAFPRTRDLLAKIMTPLKEGEIERANPADQGFMLRQSAALTSLRQACEWGMGSAPKAFRQLQLPLPFNQNTRQMRLHNIFRLYNFRVRTTGISQIKTTFNA